MFTSATAALHTNISACLCTHAVVVASVSSIAQSSHLLDSFDTFDPCTHHIVSLPSFLILLELRLTSHIACESILLPAPTASARGISM